MKREEVLTEALPYIQQFHGKTMVIKLGGHAMVDPDVLEDAIKDAVLLQLVGIRVVLVHGLSLIHISEPRDRTRSRMPSSA